MENSSQSLSASCIITPNPIQEERRNDSISNSQLRNDPSSSQLRNDPPSLAVQAKSVDEVVGTWTPSHSKILTICCLVYLLLILIIILALIKSLWK